MLCVVVVYFVLLKPCGVSLLVCVCVYVVVELCCVCVVVFCWFDAVCCVMSGCVALVVLCVCCAMC